MGEVILKKNRDFTIKHRHPWIFSGAIESVNAQNGEIVTIKSQDGEVLGHGSFSKCSQISVRMLNFEAELPTDFIKKTLQEALEARKDLINSGITNAYRIVCAESDMLPGVTIDRYGDYYVGQFTTAGAMALKDEIVKTLLSLFPAKGFYERSDVDTLKYEGIEPQIGLLAGSEPPTEIEIIENGCKYLVNVREGHKTGFYLDQRQNRAAIAKIAHGKEVLNVFSYTGGFAIAAQNAGASAVTNVDLSQNALDLAKKNTLLNFGTLNKSTFIQGNAFEVLRKMRDSAKTFDLIVLDPPKFADSKKKLNSAARGYKDINLLAMKLLRKGGLLATYSCSGLMTEDLLRKIVFEAALDSGKRFHITSTFRQSSDHPESIYFPESLYLKGFLLQNV